MILYTKHSGIELYPEEKGVLGMCFEETIRRIKNENPGLLPKQTLPQAKVATAG